MKLGTAEVTSVQVFLLALIIPAKHNEGAPAQSVLFANIKSECSEYFRTAVCHICVPCCEYNGCLPAKTCCTWKRLHFASW